MATASCAVVRRSGWWVLPWCGLWCACGGGGVPQPVTAGESRPTHLRVTQIQMTGLPFGSPVAIVEPVEPPVVDAGNDAGHADAGVEPFDAGVESFDAGVEPFDAGLETFDAGVEPFDAGVESFDAGVAPFDAGAELFDAGLDLRDAGSADAGVVGPGRRLSVHTELGVPDDSAVGRSDRWLLVKPQYVSSYDTVRRTPRWVAWRLDSTWFGPATRATSFRRDPQLPTSAGQASNTDFTNSGFDRGHLCPSADRTRTDADNDATFVFTNIVPQTHQSNAGPWEDLEDEARQLVGMGKTVTIVAGPLFGVTPSAIGSGVPVPVATFKVLVVFDGAAGVDQVTASTRVIAVSVPNTTSVSGDWRPFRVSVRSLEQQTGLDFLADVPRAVQDVVETRLDSQ